LRALERRGFGWSNYEIARGTYRQFEEKEKGGGVQEIFKLPNFGSLQSSRFAF